MTESGLWQLSTWATKKMWLVHFHDMLGFCKSNYCTIYICYCAHTYTQSAMHVGMLLRSQSIAIVMVDVPTSPRHDVQIPKKRMDNGRLKSGWVSQLDLLGLPNNRKSTHWAWKITLLTLTADFSVLLLFFVLLRSLTVSKIRKCNV